MFVTVIVTCNLNGKTGNTQIDLEMKSKLRWPVVERRINKK